MKLSNEMDNHCEILGSHLQQHHQQHTFRAHFYAEPQSQAQEKKEDGLHINYSRSKLTVSRVKKKHVPCYAVLIMYMSMVVRLIFLAWSGCLGDIL